VQYQHILAGLAAIQGDNLAVGAALIQRNKSNKQQRGSMTTKLKL
jgi:hypothetical protein